MSLETPLKIRRIQRKLYRKAKEDPTYRFYLLYDKIYREDILAYAYELAKPNQGAPGVDGQCFKQIELMGLKEWLIGLRDDLRAKAHKPQPVRRVMMPKRGGGERPLGIPTIALKGPTAVGRLTIGRADKKREGTLVVSVRFASRAAGLRFGAAGAPLGASDCREPRAIGHGS